MSSPPEHRDRARALIEKSKHMTVATANASGEPWASPVFYAHDRNYALYWVSAKNAQHSENVRTQPCVGIVIYTTDSRTDALYIAAEATELNDPNEAAPAIKVMQSRPQPERWKIKDINNVIGDAVWRIYRALPKEFYLREEGTEGGQAVVRRLRVDVRL